MTPNSGNNYPKRIQCPLQSKTRQQQHKINESPEKIKTESSQKLPQTGSIQKYAKNLQEKNSQIETSACMLEHQKICLAFNQSKSGSS